MINTIKTILEESVCEKFINEKFRTLRVSKDYQGIHIENKISMCICNDKIICNSSIIKNERYRNYKKDIDEKIEGKNKVKYIILKKNYV